MINELVQFTKQIPPRLMNYNLTPKAGLHIEFKLGKDGEEWKLHTQTGDAPEVYDGKSFVLSDFLNRCSIRSQYSWCINTNKCFDLPYKGIHSCSPYCVAFKKESLEGGTKYDKDKIKLDSRFGDYFAKAFELVAEEERQKLELFTAFFKDKQRLYSFLEAIEAFQKLKDKDYIVFYLDEPLEKYQEANELYLKDKLFNTSEYNVEREDSEELLGTSDFFNGFNSKKPYLQHQSATFDITGRISAYDARKLYEFKEMLGRRIFPRPVPIFVNQAEAEELQQKYNRLLQFDLEKNQSSSHKEIIKRLLKEDDKSLGNFYLLYYQRGEIKDFDFVPKFNYELKDDEGLPWQVHDLLRTGSSEQLLNVFDFQESILPTLFENSLIVKRKEKASIARYFDDIEAKYCKSNTFYLLVLTYRQAFYDYIYKSRRQAITKQVFDDILKTGILENIRLDTIQDNRHTEELAIKQKLNIWISLYHHFDSQFQKSKDMVNHITDLRQFMKGLAGGQRSIVTDEEGAFAAGQVIAYLFSKISSDKQPHSQLEPFLRQRESLRFRQELVKLYDRYKHENISKKFKEAYSQIMVCEWQSSMDKLMPFMLSGYFSENELFGSKETSDSAEEN